MMHNAFLSLIVPLQERLFRFAYRLLGSEEEAKDIVQDSLIKIWERREALTEVNNVEAWCIRITKNTILDRLKYNNHRMTTRLDTEADHHYLRDNESEKQMEVNDTIYSVRKIIAGLTDKHRLLIQLRDIEGFSYNEIAEIMEISIAEVKIGIFRGRQSIREKIQNLNSYGLR
jgi:RNA polymerase sigma-70 factor (ECF subfamily)